MKLRVTPLSGLYRRIFKVFFSTYYFALTRCRYVNLLLGGAAQGLKTLMNRYKMLFDKL